MKKSLLLALVVLVSAAPFVFAGTTGKVSGTITDADNREPLPGVNVILEGTAIGAVTDINGYYVILNVPPGAYTVKASYIGYTPYRLTNVIVKIDLTTTVDFKLKPEVIAGEEVVVVASRPVVVKDISASQANIEAAQIEALPVRSLTQALGLQAGIITSGPNVFEVRGGGGDQIAFVVDGFTLRDERTNQPYTALALSSIQEVQAQTGGFNAEYGNIRSGLFNVVTKEGERNKYSGTINLRYSPARPKHFGMSMYDPLSYWNRPFLDDAVCWTGTENGAWDQHTRLQYPRFIGGWNAVAEQSLKDNDPTNDLTPEAAQQVYRWQHRKQGDIVEPDYTIDAGFGGPVPFINKPLGDLRFFYSHRQEQTAYLIPLARDSYNDFIHQLKFTANITPSMKLTALGLYGEIHAVNNNNVGNAGFFYTTESIASELSQRSFITAIMYGNDYWCPTNLYRHLLAAKLTHSLSSRAYYDASLERFASFYKTAPNALRDTTKFKTFGSNYRVDEAPFGFWPYPSSGFGELRMGVGMSNSRDYSRVLANTFRFNLSGQLDAHNEIKTGLEVVYSEHNIKYGAIELTLPAGRPWSIWEKTPVRAGAYLQDKLEFKGMIANLGLRLDYVHAGGDWYALDPYNKDFYSSNYTPALDSTLTTAPTRKLYVFSPRLGISHPITENSKLFFNYGHFQSIPEASRLYLIQRVTEGSVSQIGNPNLVLNKTVAYELGYEHNLFDQLLLRATGYYKDVTNEPNWVRYTSADSKVRYEVAENNFYEDIRGFEISLDKRHGSWLSGFLNYTYMVSSTGYFGKLRFFQNPAEQRAFDSDNIYQVKPTARPYFRANVAVRTPASFGPKLLGAQVFGDWRLSLVTLWRSGEFRTWTRGLDATLIGITNNVQWPDVFNVELRLNKDLRLRGRNLRFYLDVSNLLNVKIFTPYAFSDGNDFRYYMDSLLWPRKIGAPIGYTVFGNDKIGDLRPAGVPYDPLELNPNNDPQIEARNQKRRETKSYIDNPNLQYLYYLNPRDFFLGIKIDF